MGPEQTCHKILQTIDKNKGVSIKTRYTWRVIEPPLTETELIEKAKECEPTVIGKEKAYYKLFMSPDNAVFYIDNPDKIMTIDLDF